MDIQNKIDFLLQRVEKQTPNADVDKIRRAYECANKAHDGQKRKMAIRISFIQYP